MTSQYDRRRLLRALDVYLRSCFELRTPARVSELAQILDVSRPYLSRLYRRVIGTPVGELMRERQVARAEDLLRRTALPTAEIATLAGFGTQMTLYRVFSTLRGMTPDEYRQKDTK